MANEKFSEFIVKTDLTDFTGLVGFETNTANYYITTSNFYNDLEANLDLTDFTTITGGAIGDVLTVDGTGAALEWSTPASGTVTSVAASGGTTGMTWSGSPITNSGTLTLGGTLSAGHGGTGFTGPSNIGDLIAANTASTWTSIAAGTIDYVLTSLGPGILPIWKAASGGGGTNRWTVQGSFQGWRENQLALGVPMAQFFTGGGGAGGLDDLGFWRAPFAVTIENIYMTWAYEVNYSAPSGGAVSVSLYKIAAADWNNTNYPDVIGDWGLPLMTGTIPGTSLGNDYWEDTFSLGGTIALSPGDYVTIMMHTNPGTGGSAPDAAISLQMVITE